MNKFAYKHYTYINQIFGDQTVREEIGKRWPNPDWNFDVETVTDDSGFPMLSQHHILKDASGKKWCSCTSPNLHQDISIDKNDTLCQSYTLLTYFGIDIHPDKIQRQMDMIQLYRRIISDVIFRNIIDQEILLNKENSRLWKIYPLERKHKHVATRVNTLFSPDALDLASLRVPELRAELNARGMDASGPKAELIKTLQTATTSVGRVEDVLNQWEAYGYWYFIGDGTCPPWFQESLGAAAGE
jgi:hypothetical protein